MRRFFFSAKPGIDQTEHADRRAIVRPIPDCVFLFSAGGNKGGARFLFVIGHACNDAFDKRMIETDTVPPERLVTQKPEGGTKVEVKMTLTAPGCGMGPAIAHDAQSKILSIDGVDEADVQLVWDPPWNQNMISEAGRMKLGMI